MLRAVQTGDTLQKALGIFMLRMVEDLVTGTGLHDTTGIHDCNTVTHARHDTQVMGDHDDRHTQLVLQLHHQFQDLRLNRNVQCGSRLIGDQKLRFTCQRNSDHDTLSHTTGQFMGILLHTLLRFIDTYQRQKLHCSSICLFLVRIGMQTDHFHDLIANGIYGI